MATPRTLHIIGICGTFMAGIAQLAVEMGFKVTGSDENVYPPMSDVLADLKILVTQGFSADNLKYKPDMILVGNAVKRGNPEFECVLSHKLDYQSAPEWLYHNILRNRIVIAVAGTHGKTTTTAMIIWALKTLGENPGYLVGGKMKGIEHSASLGENYFVIEADEYDTALFDKRSKFLHYHPDVLILNNLEFDHADIFRDLEDIERQFHHVLKTLSKEAYVIVNAKDDNLKTVLAKGCWSKLIPFNDEKGWHLTSQRANAFSVYHHTNAKAKIHWDLMGEHNQQNALAAIAALNAVGFSPEETAKALNSFPNVKRRMEKVGEMNGATVYDDFAHHPTAIKKTLQALREQVGKGRIIAVLEFGSYTMRAGVHKPEAFVGALQMADIILVKHSEENTATETALHKHFNSAFQVMHSNDDIMQYLKNTAQSDDNIIILSNTGNLRLQFG